MSYINKASLLSAATALVAFIAPSASAATDTWTGTTTATWNNAGNWDTLPVTGDSLVFNAAGTSGLALSNDFTSFSFGTITFGSSAGIYVIGGNSFTLTGGIANNGTALETFSNSITLSGVTAFTTTAGGGNISLTGTIGGSGGLTLSGPGSLTLTNSSNGYSGATTVNAGTLISTGSNGIRYSSTVTINSGGTIRASGTASSHIQGGLVLNGGTLLSDTSNSTYGNWNIEGGVSTGNLGTNSNISGGNVTLGQTGGTTFNVAGTDTVNVSSVIAFLSGVGDTGLIKSGTGKLILTAANTYQSATTINAGTLEIGGGGSASLSAFTLNAGTLQIDATGKTLAALTVAGGSKLVVAAQTGATTTVTGALTLGSGTITLTPVVASALSVGNTIDVFTAGSIVNSGTVSVDFTNGGLVSTRVTGTAAVNGNKLQVTVTTAGANLVWNNAAATGVWDASTNNFANGVSNDHFYTYDAVTFDDTIAAGTRAIALSGSLSAAQITVNNSSGDYSFTGSGTLTGSGSFVKNGSGQVTLSSGYAMTGSMVANAGTINLGGNTLSGISTLTVAGGTVSGGTISAGTYDLQSGTVSAILGGTGGVNKTGSGTVVLSGANIYTGTTTVTAGTLQVAASNGSKLYTIGTAGTLQLGYVDASVSNASGITINGAGVSALTGLYLAVGKTYSPYKGITIQTGATTIRSYGTGTAVLSGWDTNSTYMTTTSAASGSVVDSSINFVSGTYGYVMNVASGSANTTGDLTINGVMTGTTTYRQNGTGSILLTGANTFTGNLIIAAGSIITGNTSAVGSNALITISGGKLQVGNGTVNTVAGVGTITLSAGGLKFLNATSSITQSAGSGFTLASGFTLDLSGAFNAAGSYTLISSTGGSNSIGTYTLSGADTANYNFAFALSGSNGVLTVSAVPEPSTYGLIGAGVLASVAMIRRRRKAAPHAA